MKRPTLMEGLHPETHEWGFLDGEGWVCLDCGMTTADVLFNAMTTKVSERYGFHLWGEDSPWQANAIKVMEG